MLSRSWRKVLFAIVALLAATVAVAGWYRVHFSMATARSFEVNDPRSTPRVLIATQAH
jgi:hypothetical protein